MVLIDDEMFFLVRLCRIPTTFGIHSVREIIILSFSEQTRDGFYRRMTHFTNHEEIVIWAYFFALAANLDQSAKKITNLTDKNLR